MTTLILTPTQLELHLLEPLVSPSVNGTDALFELCGFGPVASAARAMQLIARHQPTRVILVGIAGSLRSELAVGTARSFRQVTCVGVGAGTGMNHQSADEIGWKHWVSAGLTVAEPQAGIGDVLPLAPSLTDAMELGGELLTVCAASANDQDVAMRLARHPAASAEDMEGFGVAVACYFGGIPLEIIRGISNRAGDRNKSNWDIEGALHAAGSLTLKVLSAYTNGILSNNEDRW
ncbi:MAG TPA: futalosine hydrolase [Pirellulaceae bacterium]|nr:futalosine hydrolase [Pirellulaceae bacterium]